MLMPFENFPNELVLELFNRLPREDQARLAQVCKTLHQIASTTASLKLNRYKYETQACLVGKRAIVILAKNDAPFYSPLHITFSKNKAPKITWTISPKGSRNLSAAMEKGASYLLDKLREMGLAKVLSDIEAINADKPLS